MVQGRVAKKNRAEGLRVLNENGLQWIVEMLDSVEQPVGTVIGNSTNGFLDSEQETSRCTALNSSTYGERLSEGCEDIRKVAVDDGLIEFRVEQSQLIEHAR